MILPGSAPSDERGPYISLASGRKYYILCPEADEIYLEDIVAGLHQLRWTGQAHTVGDILVHSYRVRLVTGLLGGTPLECATGLFHDAHEAFVGDVSRPMKMAMKTLGNGDSPYRQIEALGMEAVASRFKLIYPHPEVVHLADNAVLSWEVRLWGRDPVEFGLENPSPEVVRLLEGTLVHRWMTGISMRNWVTQNGIDA